MDEVVLYGSCSTDSFITAQWLRGSSHIATFKDCACSPKGLDCTRTHIFASQLDKPIIHVYSWFKQTLDQRLIIPETLSCLKISPDEKWLVGGSVSGKLYVWELESGNLLFAKESHYQEITSLEFSRNSALVFTGSKDARVFGWKLVDLVSETPVKEPCLRSNSHTLAVTDLAISQTGTRLYSCSLDQTVVCYDTFSLKQIVQYSCSKRLTSMALDPLERAIYLGTDSGLILVLSVYNTDADTGLVQSIATGRMAVTNAEDFIRTMSNGTSEPVTSLSLSFDTSTIVSGDSSGRVVAWETVSGQVMSKLKQHPGAVHRILLLQDTRPDSSFLDSDRHRKLHYTLPHFSRILNSDVHTELAHHNVWISPKTILDNSDDESGADDGFPHMASQDNSVQSQAESSEEFAKLQSELDQMHSHYESLRASHRVVWEKYVDKVHQSG